MKKADAAVKTAQETLLQAREKIELEVRQDYLNVLSYKEQIRAAEASVAQAEEAYKIATVRYSSGVGINLDVLDAELASILRERTTSPRSTTTTSVSLRWNMRWAYRLSSTRNLQKHNF